MANYNDQPANFRLPQNLHTTPLSTEAEQRIRDAAWARIVLGDDDAASFSEYFDEDEIKELGVDEATLETAFELVLAARREQLAQWSDAELTTSLTRAFDELEAQGIVARQNFSCCGNCASGEIHDERSDDKPSRGYVYFHQQDTERLVEDRGTYLGYGAFVDAFHSESAWEALSKDAKSKEYERMTIELMTSVVVPTLERHGISVTWNADLGTRIFIDNVDYVVRV